MEFMNIKTERLILPKSNEITERGEVIALAKSISKSGIMVPITVKRILNTDRYEIISGRKRFYASRIARLRELPAVIVDKPILLSRSIIKRSEKQDIFNEADTVRTVMLYEDLSIDEYSEMTGYSEKDITVLLLLTKLTEFERELVRKNSVNKYVAAEIAKIDDITTRTEILGMAIHSRLNLTETIALCKKKKGKRVISSDNAKRTPKFKDMSLFDNTLARAISLLKTSGINAKMESKESSGATEYKIRIEN